MEDNYIELLLSKDKNAVFGALTKQYLELKFKGINITQCDLKDNRINIQFDSGIHSREEVVKEIRLMFERIKEIDKINVDPNWIMNGITKKNK